jgi:hypothetical protein
LARKSKTPNGQFNISTSEVPQRRLSYSSIKCKSMLTKYEDNFGIYFIGDDDLEELEFFYHIKAQGDPKVCMRCYQSVRLLKYVTLCEACSHALEYGAPSDPTWVIPSVWLIV